MSPVQIKRLAAPYFKGRADDYGFSVGMCSAGAFLRAHLRVKRVKNGGRNGGGSVTRKNEFF